MRICFLGSSFEPGRDGVGDYTRDLAASCTAEGWEARLLALNDPHVPAPVSETQTARGIALETLRLPASMPWHERIVAAAGFLREQPTDWISLQFVCYGFHPKGLGFGLERQLMPLIGNRRLHLMLHELWIGASRGAGLRHQIVGSMQRWAIRSLIATLKPAVVHTSNSGYLHLLAKAGIRARILPLCGSIPIVANVDSNWLEHELVRLGVPASAAAPAGQWRCGFFGTLPELWSPEPLFSYLAAAAERAGRRVTVLSIGRLGPGEGIWRDMQSRYGERFGFARLGERTREEVSMFLQSIDFGLATTPWQLIGKSASTAAMLDHGLPVIVSRDDVDVGCDGSPSQDPLLRRMGADLPQWLEQVRRRPPRDRLAAMSTQFIADLGSPDSQRCVATAPR
jgi:hypothetical protein